MLQLAAQLAASQEGLSSMSEWVSEGVSEWYIEVSASNANISN
jgi:hypothetical protein